MHKDITRSSFVIIFHRRDHLCAVIDRKHKNHLSLSLPGGKSQKSESVRDTALREAVEEGWDISQCRISDEPCYVVLHQEKQKYIYWFVAVSGTALIIEPRHRQKNLPILVPLSYFLEHYSVYEYHKQAVLQAKTMLFS